MSRLLALARRYPWAAALLGGALAGGLVGLAMPPPAARNWNPGGEVWELPPPSVADRAGADAFTQVQRARLWGGNVNETATARAASWRLAGIITDPRAEVLVSVDGARVLTLAEGDALPDGAVIVSIRPDAISYERAGCRFERKLYAAAEDAGDCRDGAAADNDVED